MYKKFRLGVFNPALRIHGVSEFFTVKVILKLVLEMSGSWQGQEGCGAALHAAEE